MKQTNSLKFARKFVTGLILLTGCSLIATVQADGVYKWINEFDEVQYTQMPPPHGITAVRIQSAPSRYTDDDSDTPPSGESNEEAVDEFSDADVDADPGVGEDADIDKPKRDAALAKSRKENCNKARKNLTSLNRGNVRFIKPNGEVFRLSEEDRQQRITEANDHIKQLCKS